MKQTAVEWLEMEIVKLETKFAIPGNIYQLCEQAKEMEKQQIIEANEENMMSFTDGEQYYNKTFNKGQK